MDKMSVCLQYIWNENGQNENKMEIDEMKMGYTVSYHFF